mmetsp:Transcript_44211/g.74456  ORF Transcript_44211/g.74456 Transcript_44211/m.74456 type:complete len:385 (-) Transcript_44211:205-1359(-)
MPLQRRRLLHLGFQLRHTALQRSHLRLGLHELWVGLGAVQYGLQLLRQGLVVGAYVDFRVLLDLHRALPELDGAGGFLCVGGGRRHRYHDGGLAVARQGVLQEPRQLRIPEGHVWARWVRKGVHHAAQHQQRRVDALGLVEALTCVAGLALPLTARKVHQDQPAFQVAALAVAVPVQHIQHEQRVAAAALVVHHRRADHAALVPVAVELQALLRGADGRAQRPHQLHGVVQLRVVVQVHGAGVRDQQVLERLLVQLHHLHADSVLLGVGRHATEHLLDGLHQHPLLARLVVAERVGFAGARLPINENQPVVPIEHVIHSLTRHLLIDLALLCLWAEDMLKAEAAAQHRVHVGLRRVRLRALWAPALQHDLRVGRLADCISIFLL